MGVPSTLTRIILSWGGNATYTTTGGARNFINGYGYGINLDGNKVTFDVARGSDATADLSVSAVLWNSGSLDKTGNGIMKMSGVNRYNGETKVVAGTLMVDTGGSIATSSATVSSGATLKVNGVAGAVTVNGTLSGGGNVGAVTLNSGGTLAVGNSPGLMTAASATWNAGSAFQFEIVNATGVAGTDWDLFSVTGSLDMTNIGSANKMNLTVLSTGLQNYVVDSEYSWVFAKAASLSGTGASWISGLDVTDRFSIDRTGFNAGTQSGSDFKVVTGTDGGFATLSLKAIPEPSALSLLAVGLGVVLRRRRRS